MFKYSESEIKQLLEGIFNGSITNRELPEPLYYAIADYLRKGLYTGYGTTFSSLIKQVSSTGTAEVTLKDLDLLAELRTNIYMFSAAKTYQQVKEMSSYLVNDDGTVTPFKQFREKAMATFELYNKTWLETEYNTAIGQAQNAAKWRQIEKDADVLPILQYDAVLDKNTSAICRPLDGLTAPVNDPIWKRIMPLNHFNCRCLVKQLTEGEAELTTDGKKNALYNESMDKMQDVFKMNAGQDGYIFKKDHPYFIVPKEDKDFAKNNFNLPIPKTDNNEKLPAVIADPAKPKFIPAKTIKEAEKWAKENGIGETVMYTGITVDNANKINKTLKMVFDDFGVEPLQELRGGAKSLGLGNGRMIKFNKSKTVPDEIQKQFDNGVTNFQARNIARVKSAEEKLEQYKDTPSMLAFYQKQLKDAKIAANYTRWTVHKRVEDVVEDLFIHEAGHVIEDQLLGTINRVLIQKRFGVRNPSTRFIEFTKSTEAMRDEWFSIHRALTKEQLYSISKYGATDIHEVFAESLVMYYREPEAMAPSIKNYFDKLKEYARK